MRLSQLVKDYPNDTDLGAAVRKIWTDLSPQEQEDVVRVEQMFEQMAKEVEEEANQ